LRNLTNHLSPENSFRKVSLKSQYKVREKMINYDNISVHSSYTNSSFFCHCFFSNPNKIFNFLEFYIFFSTIFKRKTSDRPNSKFCRNRNCLNLGFLELKPITKYCITKKLDQINIDTRIYSITS
jgi:hypothetical protein